MAQTLKDIFLDCLTPKVDSVVLRRQSRNFLTMSFREELVTFEPEQSSARFFTAIEQFLDPGGLDIIDSLQCLQIFVDNEKFDAIVKSDREKIKTGLKEESKKVVLSKCLDHVKVEKDYFFKIINIIYSFISRRSSLDIFNQSTIEKTTIQIHNLHPISTNFYNQLQYYERMLNYLSSDLICNYYEQVIKIGNQNIQSIEQFLLKQLSKLDFIDFFKQNSTSFNKDFDLRILLDETVGRNLPYSEYSEFFQFHLTWIIHLQTFFRRCCHIAFPKEEASNLEWKNVFEKLQQYDLTCDLLEYASIDDHLRSLAIQYPSSSETLTKLFDAKYVSILALADHIIRFVTNLDSCQSFLTNILKENNFEFQKNGDKMSVLVESFFNVQNLLQNMPACIRLNFIIHAQKNLIRFAFHLHVLNIHFKNPDKIKEVLENYERIQEGELNTAVQTIYKKTIFKFADFLNQARKSAAQLEKKKAKQIRDNPTLLYVKPIDEISDDEVDLLLRYKQLDNDVKTCLTFFQREKQQLDRCNQLRQYFTNIFLFFQYFKPSTTFDSSFKLFYDFSKWLIDFNSELFLSTVGDETFFEKIEEIEISLENNLTTSILNARKMMIETQNMIILFDLFIFNIKRFRILTHVLSDTMFDLFFETVIQKIMESETLAKTKEINGLMDLQNLTTFTNGQIETLKELLVKKDEAAEYPSLTKEVVIDMLEKNPQTQIKCNSIVDAFAALDALRAKKGDDDDYNDDFRKLNDAVRMLDRVSEALAPFTEFLFKSNFELDILRVPILSPKLNFDMADLISRLHNVAYYQEPTFKYITNDFITKGNSQAGDLYIFIDKFNNNTNLLEHWNASLEILKTPLFSALNTWYSTDFKTTECKNVNDTDLDVLQTFNNFDQLKQPIQFVNIFRDLDFSRPTFEPIQPFLNIVFVKLPWLILCYNARKCCRVESSITSNAQLFNRQDENNTTELFSSFERIKERILSKNPREIVEHKLWKAEQTKDLRLLTRIVQTFE